MKEGYNKDIRINIAICPNLVITKVKKVVIILFTYCNNFFNTCISLPKVFIHRTQTTAKNTTDKTLPLSVNTPVKVQVMGCFQYFIH